MFDKQKLPSTLSFTLCHQADNESELAQLEPAVKRPIRSFVFQFYVLGKDQTMLTKIELTSDAQAEVF